MTVRDVDELARLDGRVALVAGGAGHIGSAVADALAQQGAAVVVADLDGDRCTEVAEGIAERRGVGCRGVAVDLCDEDATRTLARDVVAHEGRLDVLVHTAALVGGPHLDGWTTPFAEQRTDVWRHALELNLTSVFVLTQACAPALAASGHGSVVLFGSIYGLAGPDWRIYDGTDMGNAAGYAASKGGVLQLARWLATTLAPEVRVNSISPGGVFRDHPDEFRAAYEERTPLRRMATEEDLVGAAVFLASDLSAYVTGVDVPVDGGWTAW